MNRFGAFSVNDPAPDMPMGQQAVMAPAGQTFSRVYSSHDYGTVQNQSVRIPNVTPGSGMGPGPTVPGSVSPQAYCLGCDTWAAMLPIQKFGVVASYHPMPPCGPVSSVRQMANITQWTAQINNLVTLTDMYCGTAGYGLSGLGSR